MIESKKVLFIEYGLFNSSSQRVKKTLKYLPKNNWNPVVLDIWNPFLMSWKKKLEYSHNGFNQSIEIPLWIIPAALYKLGVDRACILFLPDNRIGCILSAIYRGVKIIKREHIQLIYVSCPPHSLAIIGYFLKKITKIPLVIDFRDSWSFDPYAKYPAEVFKKIDRFLCKKVLTNCDFITTISQTMCNDYTTTYPWIQKKMIVLSNGFDRSDFQFSYKPFKKFTILYAGSIYEGYSFRSPALFFKALNNIIKYAKVPRDDIAIFFIGSKCKELTNMINEYNLNDVVVQTQRIPYTDTLRHINKSHLLLLIEYSTAITGKVFEYLATGKPLLALISNGELEQLIRKNTDNSYIITSKNVQEIENSILDAYQKWKKGNLKGTSDVKLKKYRDEYNREKLTNNLAKVFNEVLKRK